MIENSIFAYSWQSNESLSFPEGWGYRIQDNHVSLAPSDGGADPDWHVQDHEGALWGMEMISLEYHYSAN